MDFSVHFQCMLGMSLFLLLLHVTYFALVSKGYHHPYMKLVIDIIFQNRSYERPPLLSQLPKYEQSTSMTSLVHTCIIAYQEYRTHHSTYQTVTIMQKMKWLMNSSKLLHDYLLMLLQQALKSWSNFNLVLFSKGQEIHKTTLINPYNNFNKSM